MHILFTYQHHNQSMRCWAIMSWQCYITENLPAPTVIFYCSSNLHLIQCKTAETILLIHILHLKLYHETTFLVAISLTLIVRNYNYIQHDKIAGQNKLHGYRILQTRLTLALKKSKTECRTPGENGTCCNLDCKVRTDGKGIPVLNISLYPAVPQENRNFKAFLMVGTVHFIPCTERRDKAISWSSLKSLLTDDCNVLRLISLLRLSF